MRAADSPCVQLRGDTSLVLMGGFTAAGSWSAAAKHNCVYKRDKDAQQENTNKYSSLTTVC